MKVLSTRQPWAYLITQGIKRIENRTWNTNYRGPILIHASQRFHDRPFELIEEQFGIELPARETMPTGAIVCVADLVDVVTASKDVAFEGPFGFVLDNAKEIKPYAMKGKLGLFEIPYHVARALQRGAR